MSESLTHGAIIEKLRTGNYDEITSLYEKHWQEMIVKARGELSLVAREYPGPDAVVGSVFESFLEKHLDNVDVSDEGGVWLMLVEATMRHCRKWNKRHQRHPTRSIFSQPTGNSPSGENQPMFDKNDRMEQPDEEVVFFELLQKLIEVLTDRQRRILNLAQQNRTKEEIGKTTRLSPATVYRELQAIEEAAHEIVEESRALDQSD